MDPDDQFPKLKGIWRRCLGLGRHVFETSKVLLFSFSF